MRVLVCGGREFDDWFILNETLKRLYVNRKCEKMTIIQGGAKGADFLAKVWVKYLSREVNTLFCEEYRAQWETFGKGAGHIRNALMISEGKPDLVVAFPGGRGTANMIKQAKQKGLEVIEVDGNTNHQEEKVQVKEGCGCVGQKTEISDEGFGWVNKVGNQCPCK